MKTDIVLTELNLCSTYEDLYCALINFMKDDLSNDDPSILSQGGLPFYWLYLYGVSLGTSCPAWLSETLSTKQSSIAYDAELVATYGFRRVSKRIIDCIKFKSSLDPYFPKLSNIIMTFYSENNDRYSRIYEVLVTADYNPIHNYDMDEHEEVNTNMHNETYQDVDTYGFNSSTEVPSGKGHSETDTTGDVDDNYRDLNRSGNIGVTTTQHMITEEISLRQHKFMNIIINDLGEFLTRPQY